MYSTMPNPRKPLLSDEGNMVHPGAVAQALSVGAFAALSLPNFAAREMESSFDMLMLADNLGVFGCCCMLFGAILVVVAVLRAIPLRESARALVGLVPAQGGALYLWSQLNKYDLMCNYPDMFGMTDMCGFAVKATSLAGGVLTLLTCLLVTLHMVSDVLRTRRARICAVAATLLVFTGIFPWTYVYEANPFIPPFANQLQWSMDVVLACGSLGTIVVFGVCGDAVQESRCVRALLVVALCVGSAFTWAGLAIGAAEQGMSGAPFLAFCEAGILCCLQSLVIAADLVTCDRQRGVLCKV